MEYAPRLRGRHGQKQRARRLKLFPLCRHCEEEGVIKATEEIDHIIPLFKGIEAGGTDEDDNVQGLCYEHHKIKTAKDLGHKKRQTIGVDGWPIERERK